MKRLLFLLFIFLLTQSCVVAQQWNWVTGSFSSSIVEGHNVCVDQHHNTWATGYFNDSLSLGPFTVYAPHSGIYIAKFDPAGNPLLLIQSDTSGYFADGYGICADLFGNIYVTGRFSGDLIIQQDTLHYVQTNSPDAFLLKLDTTGNILWSRSAFGNGDDYGVSVSCDSTGNVFMSGTFQSNYFFIGQDTLICIGPSSVFLSKYDPNGNEIWAKQSYAYDEVEGAYSSVDKFGNIYLSGVFKFSVSFGNLTYTTNSNIGEGFIVKFDSSGAETWLKGKVTSHGQVIPRAIAVDPAGHPVICGVFTDSLFFFGPDSLRNTLFGQYRSFVAKYDSSGNELWARGDQSGDAFNSWAVTTDNQGNIYYVAGTFIPSQQSFTVEGTTISYTNISFDPGFIASFDSYGNLGCVSLMPSGTDDFAGMCADPNGSSVMVSGDLVGDTLLFGSTFVYGSGTEYLFAASWSCSIGKNEIDEKENNKIDLQFFPNPAISQTELNFTLSKNADVEISLYDSEGKKIKSVREENLFAGKNSVELNLSDLNAGIYLCRMETSEGQEAHTLIVKLR